jgi:hypothetical protein
LMGLYLFLRESRNFLRGDVQYLRVAFGRRLVH